jgi:hypothetical protein
MMRLTQKTYRLTFVSETLGGGGIFALQIILFGSDISKTSGQKNTAHILTETEKCKKEVPFALFTLL